jgi:hypothetical protein
VLSSGIWDQPFRSVVGGLQLIIFTLKRAGIFKRRKGNRWVAHEARSAVDCRSRSRSARDPPQNLAGQKLPTFCSAASRRRLPATVAPLPACPRTAALRLALCPSLLRVSSFTFVLQRAHLPAFHSHFLTAHNTQFHRSPSCFSVLTCLDSIDIYSLHTIQVHR